MAMLLWLRSLLLWSLRLHTSWGAGGALDVGGGPSGGAVVVAVISAILSELSRIASTAWVSKDARSAASVR